MEFLIFDIQIIANKRKTGKNFDEIKTKIPAFFSRKLVKT